MKERVFYHIYPLGFCGAAERNDFSCPAGGGLRFIKSHVSRLLELGVNAVYLGPLFESTAHGYDTLDYFWVDRRLGTNDDLVELVRSFHRAGIAVVLDAVLNHTGRHFFAFKDLRERGSASPYWDWFAGLDFSRRSPAGDPFWYEGWNNCYDLVKLNGSNPAVREHLLGAAEFWIKTFDIDGLRLDAADLLREDFMDELSRRCKTLKPSFWLVGEVVGGDYRHWAWPGRLDSVTNYELYKSLWSSFNDANFFELSWTLNRQFGGQGMYRDIALYNFLDNHDVNRIASTVKNPAHLLPLYGLLFSLPGIPSVYYGSEYGIRGEREHHSDRPLRPAWGNVLPASGGENLKNAIARFAEMRKKHPALQSGSFREIHRSHEQYAFVREGSDGTSGGSRETVLAAVNSGESPATLGIALGGGTRWKDLLSGEILCQSGEHLNLPLASAGFRVFQKE